MFVCYCNCFSPCYLYKMIIPGTGTHICLRWVEPPCSILQTGPQICCRKLVPYVYIYIYVPRIPRHTNEIIGYVHASFFWIIQFGGSITCRLFQLFGLFIKMDRSKFHPFSHLAPIKIRFSWCPVFGSFWSARISKKTQVHWLRPYDCREPGWCASQLDGQAVKSRRACSI